MRHNFLKAITVLRYNNLIPQLLETSFRSTRQPKGKVHIPPLQHSIKTISTAFTTRGGGEIAFNSTDSNNKNSTTFVQSLATSTTTTSTGSTIQLSRTIMSDASTEETNNVWIRSEEDNGEAFARLSHVGYTLESNPNDFTGGWLAHRLALQPKPSSTTSTTKGEEEATETTTDDSNTNEENTNKVVVTELPCWIRDEVASKLTKFNYEDLPIGRPPRILVLYGSLRPTSFSRKLAYEFARLLETLGCDVRTYNPHNLPVRDPSLESHVKVQELRSLTLWSDGHVWVSPEMHGQITGVFKNQIDWIPLNSGSVRPTQGRTCCVAQVNGGSQSFNAVNTLRLLARWMRMPCCTNQSSVAKAWQEFDDDGRMKPSSYRDRVVDVAEEFAKFTAVITPVANDLNNRYSERKEKEKEGRLLTQAEKEAQKTITESRKA